MAKKAEVNKQGVFQGGMIEENNTVRILANDIYINPNLAKNTTGIEEKGYTVPTSGGSEGGPRYAVTGIEGGKTYTVSACIKGSANMNLYTLNSGGNVAYTWINKTDMSAEYKLYSLTFTMATGKGTTNEIYICTRYTTTPTPGDWFKILPNSVKIEEGSVATPWIPNSNDTAYTKFGFSTVNTVIIDPIKAEDFYEI